MSPPGRAADAKLATIAVPDAQALARAARLLAAGELVAFPTETVYGLGADATNPAAVARIFAAKGRPNDHPVIVHVLPDASLDTWAARVSPAAQRLIDRFWPGPLTLVLPRASGVSDAVTGGQDTVGLRSPSHPVALALLRAFVDAGGSGALAAPSANRFGRISPTTAEHVALELADRVSLVLDGGRCEVGIESTILDLSRERPVLLRPGHIAASELADTLDEAVWAADGALAAEPAQGRDPSGRPAAPAGAAPRVSGGLAAHYAPRTALRLVESARLPDCVAALCAGGARVGVWSRHLPANAGAAVWREAPGSATAFAHALYAMLRELDAAGLDVIVVETPPEQPAWAAVRDRLRRAAAGAGADSAV